MSIPSAPKASRIWTWLLGNPASTADQVEKALGMPRKNTAALLSEMERAGFVSTQRVHSDTARRHVRLYTAVDHQ